METPSKSSLPRAPLGSLDANSHILSSRSGTPPHKPSSTMKSNTFTTPGKGLYSLKDTIISSPAQRTATMAQPTPVRALYRETSSRSNEKRKEAPTSAYRDAEDEERAVKQARFSESMGHGRQDSGHGHSVGHSRQSSASGHGHKLFGEIATRVETEEDMDSSQGTIANSSFNDEHMADASQLTAVSAPDVDGPARTVRRTPSPENLRAVSPPLYTIT